MTLSNRLLLGLLILTSDDEALVDRYASQRDGGNELPYRYQDEVPAEKAAMHGNRCEGDAGRKRQAREEHVEGVVCHPVYGKNGCMANCHPSDGPVCEEVGDDTDSAVRKGIALYLFRRTTRRVEFRKEDAVD